MITLASPKKKTLYHQTDKKEYSIVFDKCSNNWGSYYCYILYNDRILLDAEFIISRLTIHCLTNQEYEESTRNGIVTYKFYIKAMIVKIDMMMIPKEDPMLFITITDW